MMNGNAPAYPHEDKDRHMDHSGLSKRELFAAMAMNGLLASSPESNGGFSTAAAMANAAIEAADALLAELAKGGSDAT